MARTHLWTTGATGDDVRKGLVAAVVAVTPLIAVVGLALLAVTAHARPAMPAVSGPTTGAERGLTPAALVVRREVAARFGVTDIGGWAPGTGHVRGSDHYEGRALDIMLTPVNAANAELGWRIARYLQSNASRLRITYLIWQGRIWNVNRATEGWRPYRHPSGRGGATLLHYDHVHVSVS